MFVNIDYCMLIATNTGRPFYILLTLQQPITKVSGGQIRGGVYIEYLCPHNASLKTFVRTFLSDPGVPGVRSMGPDVRPSLKDYVQT